MELFTKEGRKAVKDKGWVPIEEGCYLHILPEDKAFDSYCEILDITPEEAKDCEYIAVLVMGKSIVK